MQEKTGLRSIGIRLMEPDIRGTVLTILRQVGLPTGYVDTIPKTNEQQHIQVLSLLSCYSTSLSRNVRALVKKCRRNNIFLFLHLELLFLNFSVLFFVMSYNIY